MAINRFTDAVLHSIVLHWALALGAGTVFRGAVGLLLGLALETSTVAADRILDPKSIATTLEGRQSGPGMPLCSIR